MQVLNVLVQFMMKRASPPFEHFSNFDLCDIEKYVKSKTQVLCQVTWCTYDKNVGMIQA
jgi:hypothetical protein